MFPFPSISFPTNLTKIYAHRSEEQSDTVEHPKSGRNGSENQGKNRRRQGGGGVQVFR
jgi:hypothetical protein